MKIKNFKISPLQLLLTFAHILLAVLGSINYPGSPIFYIIFSASFLVLLLESISSSDSPGFIFFGTMMWLGFFGKITAHLILLYPFIEPTGGFSGLPAEWDETLLVASTAAVACSLSREFFRRYFKNSKPLLVRATSVPKFFIKQNKFIYLGFLGLLAFVTVFNMVLGINLSGIAAVTVLPWPLNAVTGWLLYIGLAIMVAQLSQWEFSSLRKSQVGFYLGATEGFLSSISIISRGLMLFHMIPTLVVTFLNRVKLNCSWPKLTQRFVIVLTLFIVSSSLVTLLRDYLFIGKVLNNPGQSYSLFNSVQQAALIDGKLGIVTARISGLAIDRWIGAEGVMAVVAYPNKSFEMLQKSFFRTPKVGEADIFEEVSKSQYVQNSKYVFATIPGPTAFFYYSGKLWVVFAGMTIFVLLLTIADQLVFRIFSNSFLSAQIAFYLANSFAQFGISPRPLLISFFMTSVALAILAIANRYLDKNNFSLKSES